MLVNYSVEDGGIERGGAGDGPDGVYRGSTDEGGGSIEAAQPESVAASVG